MYTADIHTHSGCQAEAAAQCYKLQPPPWEAGLPKARKEADVASLWSSGMLPHLCHDPEDDVEVLCLHDEVIISKHDITVLCSQRIPCRRG